MSSKLRWSGFFALFFLATLAACDGGSSTPGQTATVITSQPTDQSVVEGTTATMNVVATNATGYQWQKSSDGGTTFASVIGATATSYTTAVTTLADSDTRYRVVVSGTINSVTSSAVMLTVTAAPVAPGISVHPGDQTITEGQNASFSVTATGTTLGYQWQRSTDGGISFANVVTATNATLTLTAVPLGDNGQQFHVVVSNSAGSIPSNAALLTVNAAPSTPLFTTQPASVTIVEGQNTQFEVAVSGTPAPSLQWQLSTDSGANWSNIVGETGTIFTVTAPALANNGRQFRAVASNSEGTVNSNAATLTISAAVAPAFTSQPADASITEGQNAQFTVVVSGTPTPNLQWQLSTDSGANWSNINGATGSVFDVVGAALADTGRQYRAVATNSAASVASSAATLTVTAAVAVTITTTSPLPAGITGVPYSVSLTTSGGTPPFTWSVANGSTLPAFLTLNASTGEISGTPTVAAAYGWAVDVFDSANPQQSDQKYFDLTIEAPCDNGYGSATVAGAPITVEGKFCPGSLNGPIGPYGDGTIIYVWVETYPYGGGSYYENVGVRFHPVSGQVTDASFNLHDMTRSWSYSCTVPGTIDYPACSGVTVDIATGIVTFVNTIVGSGSSAPFTLNGALTY